MIISYVCRFSFFKQINHFFLCISVSIESVGAVAPDELFVDAIKLLMSKCDRLLQEIDGNTNN